MNRILSLKMESDQIGLAGLMETMTIKSRRAVPCHGNVAKKLTIPLHARALDQIEQAMLEGWCLIRFLRCYKFCISLSLSLCSLLSIRVSYLSLYMRMRASESK